MILPQYYAFLAKVPNGPSMLYVSFAESPPDKPRRVACPYLVGGDGLCHHRPSPDDTVVADGHPFENDTFCTDKYIVAYNHRGTSAMLLVILGCPYHRVKGVEISGKDGSTPPILTLFFITIEQ